MRQLRAPVPRDTPRVDYEVGSSKEAGATRNVAPVLLSIVAAGAVLLAGCTKVGAQSNEGAPAQRPPAAGAQPFEGSNQDPTAASSTAAPGPTTTNVSPFPSGEVSSSTAPPPPSASAAEGQGGGVMPNTCDARYELSGNKLYVHVVTDTPPGKGFYSGYLAEDANGNAYGRMFRGADFEMPYKGGPVVFIAAPVSLLAPGAGETGILPPGVQGYTWCGTYQG